MNRFFVYFYQYKVGVGTLVSKYTIKPKSVGFGFGNFFCTSNYVYTWYI